LEVICGKLGVVITAASRRNSGRKQGEIGGILLSIQEKYMYKDNPEPNFQKSDIRYLTSDQRCRDYPFRSTSCV